MKLLTRIKTNAFSVRGSAVLLALVTSMTFSPPAASAISGEFRETTDNPYKIFIDFAVSFKLKTVADHLAKAEKVCDSLNKAGGAPWYVVYFQTNFYGWYQGQMEVRTKYHCMQ